MVTKLEAMMQHTPSGHSGHPSLLEIAKKLCNNECAKVAPLQLD